MNLKKMSKEELENMSYDDIAYMLLEEKNKQMKIIDLFNEIGKLVNLSSKEIEDKIGDFFEILTLDKRFIMLDDGFWDLRNRHAQDIVIEDEEDSGLNDEIEEPEEENEEDEDIFYDENENEDDSDDDLKDLVIMDEDEEDSL